MGKPGTFSIEDERIISTYVESPAVAKVLYAKDIILKHLGSELKILVNAKDIHRLQKGNYRFIKGKATLVNKAFSFNGKVEVPCRIACGSLYTLKDVITEDVVNILDYLDHLIPPRTNKCVGVVTFQNGIQNTEKDFEKMGESIIAKFKEQQVNPLCIGLYNATNGAPINIIEDFERLFNEWDLNAQSIITFRQMIVTLARTLPQHVLWTHIAHSEAGLIAHEVFTSDAFNLSKQNLSLKDVNSRQIATYTDIKGFCKRQLITLAYGAVGPIPNSVLSATNNYATEDITMHYAKKYLDKLPKPVVLNDESLKQFAHGSKYSVFSQSKSAENLYAELKSKTDQAYINHYPYESTKHGCTVKIIESVGGPFFPVPGDHAFQGDTYQNQLKTDLKELSAVHRIHRCKVF